jgi:hypothetical protein
MMMSSFVYKILLEEKRQNGIGRGAYLNTGVPRNRNDANGCKDDDHNDGNPLQGLNDNGNQT